MNFNSEINLHAFKKQEVFGLNLQTQIVTQINFPSKSITWEIVNGMSDKKCYVSIEKINGNEDISDSYNQYNLSLGTKKSITKFIAISTLKIFESEIEVSDLQSDLENHLESVVLNKAVDHHNTFD